MTSTINLFAALSIFIALFCGRAEAATAVVVKSVETDCNAQRCLPPTIGYGSGVVIGKMADGTDAVLTCAHVVGRGTVEIGWTDGWVPARVVMSQYNSDFDVSLLSANLPNSECSALSGSEADADIFMTGHVQGRGWRTVRGKYVYRGGSLQGIAAIPGESGCPATDVNGDVVGIVKTTDGISQSFVTESVKIRWWLKQKLGYIPSCQSQAPNVPPQVARPDCAVPTPPTNRDPIIIDVPGCDCKNYDAEIAAIRDEIKAMKAPIRVQIQRDGKFVDEDTYDVFNGQPIVLNFKKKTSQPQSATGK